MYIIYILKTVDICIIVVIGVIEIEEGLKAYKMDINKLAGKFDDIKSGFYKHSYLQITDDSELIVDRCEKVIAYDENLIKLKLKNNGLNIVGIDMKMRNFSIDGVIIGGKIHSLEFIAD